jgi:hypothetical protein
VSVNPHEDAARERKVTALLTVLLAAGHSAEDAETLWDEGWSYYARVAGVKPPSETTRARVVEALRNHARIMDQLR